MINSQTPLWVIIPAGGHGARFGETRPKQYVEVFGKSILQHTIGLFNQPFVKQIVVPLIGADFTQDGKVVYIKGGQTRADSVWQALTHLKNIAQVDDWVLVHDAARPCLHPDDCQKLIHQLQAEPVGGILARPVSYTLKQVKADVIVQTVPRDGLYEALTPQMFRLGQLYQALIYCQQQSIHITDDAGAIEAHGKTVKIVKADHPNPKLTSPDDLKYITWLLTQREQAVCFE